VTRAREHAAPAVVLTFEPHPLAVLAPAREPARLTSDRQREALLAGLGVDLLWLVPFDRELAAWPAERFVRDLLAARLAPSAVAVGSRFAFGRGREGDVALLARLGGELGFAVEGIAEHGDGAGAVSSTRVRAAVRTGDVETAAALLGRDYAVDGEVVAGDQRGHRIGFPTANVQPADGRQLLPEGGVYAAKLTLDAEHRSYAGAANLGVRPTRGAAGATTLEIHLFDFDRDIYGERVELAFCRRLRAERRFESFEALRRQIGSDVEEAREYFRIAAR
jgi:riboflavin kinase / FMN adenylyltransferase